MSGTEILLLDAYAIQPLVPVIIAIAIATLIAVVAVLIKGRALWVNKPNFVLGLFFEIRAPLTIKLSCAWIKLVVTIFYLFAFVQLSGAHYIFLLVPCAGLFMTSNTVSDFLFHFSSMSVQLVGLFGSNILCSYIIQFEMNFGYISLYVLVAMLLALYNVYVFIFELDLISKKRSVKLDKATKE